MTYRFAVGPTGRRPWPAFAALFVALAAAPAALAQQPVRYFKNYFVTGDYVAAGVGLRAKGVNGFATGTITVDPAKVPAGAEVVAAYLYWQTLGPATGPVASTLAGARFKKNDLAGSAVLTNPGGSPACPDSSDDDYSYDRHRDVYAYRADVLRFFPRRVVPATATTPARVVVEFTGAHEVRLPDSGSRSRLPNTLGAGLVVVFRVPGYDGNAAVPFSTPKRPLRSVVIFDGAATLNRRSPPFDVTLEGFYEASRAAPGARLTQMAGNGSPRSATRVDLSSTLQSTDNVLVATNAFVGAGGGGNPVGATGTGFDVVTWESAPLAAGAMKARLGVRPSGPSYCGCLNLGPVVLSTIVQDRDLDGLLDVWESQAEWSAKTAATPNYGAAYSRWPLTDPTGVALPNLQAMGASPDVQDVFVQIDAMVGADGHTHLPTKPALDAVASTFRTAPQRPALVAALPRACGPGVGQCPINVHFDVGPNYQPAATVTTATCLAPGGWTPDCAIVRTDAGAKGGNAIPEVTCAPNPDDPGSGLTPSGAKCAFPGFAGIVGWKGGYRAHRDAPVDVVTRKACATGAAGCEPRFARNRKDIFRYALFAHGLGYPSPSSPTVPRKSSGIADVSGADMMVTLGLWDPANPRSNGFLQASTLLHELGHTFGLRHGGVVPSGAIEPNCKPNYQSVMNYLFQVGGLLNASGAPALDYSRRTLPTLNEGALSEAAGFGAVPDYRPRWYAPRGTSAVANALGTTAATRRCDGSLVPAGSTPYVRIDGPIDAAIDWNGDGAIAGTVAQDANLDGDAGETFLGADDFDAMDLRQVGSRRAVGSASLSYSVVDPVTGVAPVPPAPALGGGLSLDTGYADLGYADLGYADLGYADLGYADLGYADLGYADLGYGDLGFGELGVPEADPTAQGEVTFEAAVAVAIPPSALQATVVSGGVQLSWVPPTVLTNATYLVYRVPGTDVTAAALAQRVLVATTTVTALVEGLPPCNEYHPEECITTTFTYFVVARSSDPTDPSKLLSSSPSNFATVTVRFRSSS